MKDNRYCERHMNHVAMHLLWSEIEFDVKYGIAKRARLAGVQGESRKDYVFTDSDEDWLMRTIDTAIANVKSKLVAYIVDYSKIPSNEILEKPMHYDLVFDFENGWQGHPDTLMNLIHSYITEYCIAEFIKMIDYKVASPIYENAETLLLKAYTEANSFIIETPKFIL